MLEIKVGPPQLAIHQGYTVLVTEPDGQIDWPTDKGLYFLDTRLISGWYDLRQRRALGAAQQRRPHLLRAAHLS